MTEHSIAPDTRLDQLRQIGDPRKRCRWHQGSPDYADALGLSSEDVPELVEIARSWLLGDWSDDPYDTSWQAPIHAWRALAQLRAPEAVELLLEMLGPMDARGDDWHLEEFPRAFALIGAAAFDPVADYLADASRTEFARVCAAHGLCCLAQKHPGLRERAVGCLTNQLSAYQKTPRSLNAFLIVYLVDLRATEAAEVIERAFAAHRVDEIVVGDWHRIRADLGVEGIGLVPAPERRRTRGVTSGWPPHDPPASRLLGFKSRKAEQRKRQRQARRRGRRR